MMIMQNNSIYFISIVLFTMLDCVKAALQAKEEKWGVRSTETMNLIKAMIIVFAEVNLILAVSGWESHMATMERNQGWINGDKTLWETSLSWECIQWL